MYYCTATEAEYNLTEARAEVEEANAETAYWTDCLAQAKRKVEREEAECALVFFRHECERTREELRSATARAVLSARLEQTADERCEEARQAVQVAPNPGYAAYEVRKRYGWGDPATKAAYKAVSVRAVAREESRV